MATRRAQLVVVALACVLCHCLLGLADSFVAGPLARSTGAARLPAAAAAGVTASAQSTPSGIVAACAASLAATSLTAALSAKRGTAGRLHCVACAAKKGKKGGGGGGGQKGAGGGGAAPAGGDAPEVDVTALMNDWQGKLDKLAPMLREKLMGIRAGQATASLLDSITVDAYDTKVAVKEIATITTTDSRTLTCVCFDDTIAPALDKAIKTAALGYSSVQTGAEVKVGIPELTQDKRKQYIKVAQTEADKLKKQVSDVRQKAMKKVKGLKQLTQDQQRSLQKDVEDMVKGTTADLDSIFKKKQDELNAV